MRLRFRHHAFSCRLLKITKRRMARYACPTCYGRMLGRTSSPRQGSERLARRRQGRHRRVLIAFFVLLLLLLGAAIWGVRQSAVRISHIDIFGADPSLEGTVRDALTGYYLGIIPRDSI